MMERLQRAPSCAWPRTCAKAQRQGHEHRGQSCRESHACREDSDEPQHLLPKRTFLLATTGLSTLPYADRAEAEQRQKGQPSSSTPEVVSEETGVVALRNPALYRGSATEKAARRAYKLDGLLPRRRVQLQVEVDRARKWIDLRSSPLEKYQALMTLKETNRSCFFAVLEQNITSYLPIVYTPTVGEACKEWSHLIHRPTGLYISINDLGDVQRIVDNWPEDRAKVAVITDGERILGLGDLGANGLGIAVGKAIVHTAAGGIQPRLLIPIVLDVGCNSQDILEDPLYVGLRQKRVQGPKYDALVDEVLAALLKRYGDTLLVHWEDFSARNSYRLLARARSKGVTTFNDDIESTAAAVLAAVLGAAKIKGVPPLRQQTFAMLGAGQANIGSARLLCQALQGEGLSEKEAKDRIWLFDSKGLVYTERQEGKLTKEKQEFQRSEAEGKELGGQSFAAAIQTIKPTAAIGAAGKRGAFSESVIKALSQGVEERFGESARPIVLALSNPDTVAECTADEAYQWSGGKAIYASGTTFPPVTSGNGIPVVPSQANNSLIFPGISLGCIACGATAVTGEMMLAAGKAVSRKLTQQELSQTSILPSTKRLREVALSVAAAVAMTAVESMEAKPTELSILECLPLGKSADDPSVLKQAESCISKLRYVAFDFEQLSPNPVSPILL